MSLDITLLRPLWLLLLPAIAVFGWWLHRRRGALGDWERAARPELLRAMAALGRVERQGVDPTLVAVLVAAGLAVIALAGPAVERRDAVSFRNLDGVVFVLDASASVTEAARWPQMQTVGRFGLAALGTRPAGLVLYAGDAYVGVDMTVDHRQLGQSWSLIGPETVTDPGSRPERGLDLALRMLAESEVLAGDVVLFTDGGGLGPAALTLAEQIAARGARLSAVSLAPVGAAGAAPEMEALVSLGQGRTFGLEQTDDFAAWMAEEARSRLEAQDFPLLFWRDLGRWLVLLALLPLLALFRRTAA